MTKFVRRALETAKELTWQATRMALESCELTLDDIDAVCLGTAPDAFDGVHMNGEYLSDGAGGWSKPYMRSYVGGGTGVFTPIQGWYHVASGLVDVVLVVRGEDVQLLPARPGRLPDHLRPHHRAAAEAEPAVDLRPGDEPLHADLRHLQGDIARVAVQHKRNAAGHPCALLGDADITVEDVLDSEVLAWPVHRLDVSPVSDGAVALVLAAEHVARRVTDKPVWIQGVGWHLDTAYWTNRDLAYPRYVEYAARMAYEMAGIREPRKEIHIAEPYDPFDYKALHHLEGLLLADRGKAASCTSTASLPGTGHAGVPVRRAARRGQPHRRGGPDEDRRAVLAAARRGRRPPGAGHSRSAASPRPGAT